MTSRFGTEMTDLSSEIDSAESPLLGGDEPPRPNSRTPFPRGGIPKYIGIINWGWGLWLMAFLNLFYLIAIIYLLSQDDTYKITGDRIFSNSSRFEVEIDDSTEPPTALINIVDVYGIWGGANYSCEPNRPVQPVATIPSAGLGGLTESWYNVLLLHTIENSHPAVYDLDDNLYSVTISESGGYNVHAEVNIAAPLNLTDVPLSVCIFVDYEEIGLYDVLRRTAPQCQPAVFVGSDEFGPLLTISSFDWIYIENPTAVQIRLTVVSDTAAQLAIILSRLKLMKN